MGLIGRIKEARAAATPAEVVEEEAETVEEAAPAEEVAAVEETTPVEETAVETEPAVEETTAEEPAPVEETDPVESAPVEEAVPVEEAASVEETAPAEEADEEDAPLEDWTKKELADECKTLGLSDKGTKAVLIGRIKEARESAVATSAEEPMEVTETAAEAVVEAAVEEAAVVEAAVEEPIAETETASEVVEEATHPAVVTEELNDDGIEIVTEIVTLNDETPTENAAESITEPAPKETTSSDSLDSSAISDLITKNANGLMTQQDFFRVFLMSVQNGISTNQRLEQIEKRLTDAEEKIKSTEEAPAVEAVEAVETETPVTEAAEEPMEVEAAAEEPAAETVVPETDKTVDESMDISSMVEIAEKTRTSRKRGKVSQAGRASQSPIPSRAKRTRAK